MSLIVGQYYRGNPRQKPKQWGSISSVQSAVVDYFNSLGVVAPSVFFPVWEKAGVPIELMSGTPATLGTLNGVWTVDGYKGNSTTDTAAVSIVNPIELEFPYTIMEVYRQNTASVSGISFSISNATNWNKRVITDHAVNRVNRWAVHDGSTLNTLSGNYVGWGLYIGDLILSVCCCLSATNRISYGFNCTTGVLLDTYQSTASLNAVSGCTHAGFGYYTGSQLSDYDEVITPSLGCVFNCDINLTTLNKIAENCYASLQPPAFRTYFDLAEIGAPIEAINSDLSEFSDNVISSLISTKLLSDNITLSDNSISDLLLNTITSDTILFSDYSVVDLIINNILSDGIKLSESVISTLISNVLITNGINVSDVTISNLSISLLSGDITTFSDTITPYLVTSSTINEGIKLFDVIIGELLIGSVTWGHDTAVIEDYSKNFTDWSGTGSVLGSNDSEQVQLDVNEYLESPTWHIGPGNVRLRRNVYLSGKGEPVITYKQGSSLSVCEADTWHSYTEVFACDGWIKIKLENTGV